MWSSHNRLSRRTPLSSSTTPVTARSYSFRNNRSGRPLWAAAMISRLSCEHRVRNIRTRGPDQPAAATAGQYARNLWLRSWKLASAWSRTASTAESGNFSRSIATARSAPSARSSTSCCRHHRAGAGSLSASRPRRTMASPSAALTVVADRGCSASFFNSSTSAPLPVVPSAMINWYCVSQVRLSSTSCSSAVRTRAAVVGSASARSRFAPRRRRVESESVSSANAHCVSASSSSAYPCFIACRSIADSSMPH